MLPARCTQKTDEMISPLNLRAMHSPAVLMAALIYILPTPSPSVRIATGRAVNTFAKPQLQRHGPEDAAHVNFG